MTCQAYLQPHSVMLYSVKQPITHALLYRKYKKIKEFMISSSKFQTYVAGTEDHWPWVFIFNAFPAALCLICMPFCPESPRYLLIKKGNEQDARDGKKSLSNHFMLSFSVSLIG